MSHEPSHSQFTADTSPLQPASGEAASQPDSPTAPDKKTKGAHKKHPPAVYRPPYTGKRVQDSPYYITPTDALDLLLAVTLDRKLTPSARDVFGLIVAHYNHRKGYAHPGRERMAELLGLTETAISEAIKLLTKRGWLRVEQERVDGHAGRNHYFPQLDQVTAIVAEAGFKVRKTGASETSKVRLDDEQGPVLQDSKVRFDEVSRSGKPDANPHTLTPKENPKKEPDTPKGVVSPGGFLKANWFPTFWEFYPHKVEELEAQRAFADIVKDDGALFEAIMEAVEPYGCHLEESGVYPTAPAAWLRKGKWKDQPFKIKPKPPSKPAPQAGVGTGRLAI